MKLTSEEIESLKIKWKPIFDSTSHIWTWTEDHCMAYLAEMANSTGAKIVVESGTYMGASAYMMLLGAPAIELFAVDPFMVSGTEKATRYYLRKFITDGRCNVLAMRSNEGAEKLTPLIGGKVDMAWIDNGHATCDVEYDIDSWYPLLRSGGLICGHDLDPGGPVEAAVKNKLPGYFEPVPRLWAFFKP
jgi:predicted O-methyltransferase YrrM